MAKMKEIVNSLNMYDKCNTIGLDIEVLNMISIRLTQELEKQLKEVAKFEGLSVSDYVRSIIVEKLEDYFDYKTAIEISEKVKNNKEKLYTHDEVFGK